MKWAANNLFAIARQTDGPTNLTNEPGIPNGPGRHAKFQKPRAIPSRRNYGSKKEREKTQWPLPRSAHALHSDQFKKLDPMSV